MARKPITYAHRKNRKKAVLQAYTSSPSLQPISDLANKLLYPETPRRMLKRSRPGRDVGSADTMKDQSSEKISKKLKSTDDSAQQESLAPVSASQLTEQPYELQTPHQTHLTEEQIFKLESSRGVTLPPNYGFSPVPQVLSQGIPKKSSTEGINAYAHRQSTNMRKTSSSNLKENSAIPLPRSSSKSGLKSSTAASRSITLSRTRPYARGLGPSLASPFTSKPSSPHGSPRSSGNSNSIRSTSNRMLSDTHYNPNLPTQAQSTANSPVSRRTDDEIIRARRPSAPSVTAQRPIVASLFSRDSPSTNACHDVPSSLLFDIGDVFGRGAPVDFNRPPSQLSYNSSYDEAFFSNALKVSTPSGLRKKRHIPISGYLDDSEEEYDQTLPSCTLHSSNMQFTLPLSGSWMSDSLISSPTLSREDAYTRPSTLDHDVTMNLPHESDSLGLGDGMELRKFSAPVSGHLDIPLASKHREESLQELFDGLGLGFGDDKPRSVPRTRSLDIEPNSAQPLQSPAQISLSPLRDKQMVSGAAREKHGGRDRRGTIRASEFPALGSSAADLGGFRRTRSGTVVQAPTRGRRERSGTILAKLASCVTISTASADLSSGDVDMDYAGEKQPWDSKNVSMSTESDDELLLKTHWCDEDWVVAEPPSPEMRHRSTRKKNIMNDWRKRFELKKTTGIWTTPEHREGDGEGDPLLLQTV